MHSSKIHGYLRTNGTLKTYISISEIGNIDSWSEQILKSFQCVVKIKFFKQYEWFLNKPVIVIYLPIALATVTWKVYKSTQTI